MVLSEIAEVIAACLDLEKQKVYEGLVTIAHHKKMDGQLSKDQIIAVIKDFKLCTDFPHWLFQK